MLFGGYQKGGAAWAGLAVGLGLAGLPWLWPGYHLQLLTVIFFWIGLAGAWNLGSGFTGNIDFGSAAYVGVGSYVSGLLLLKLKLPLLACVLAGGLGAAVVGLALGWPTLKLRGAYFAIATFALAEALKAVCTEWASLTAGGLGLTMPLRLTDSAYYYLYLVLAAAMVGLTWRLDRSKFGYGLKAIRQDEAAAALVGVDTHCLKVQTFVLSSFFIGLLGALEATRLSYFKPDDVFSVQLTIKMVIMSLLGGLGTVLGPVAGAFFLQVVEDLLGARFLNFYLVLVGLVIVGVILFLPRGLLGGWPSRRPRQSVRAKDGDDGP
jgi:branched-chain amino acid transport system permease protein